MLYVPCTKSEGPRPLFAVRSWPVPRRPRTAPNRCRSHWWFGCRWVWHGPWANRWTGFAARIPTENPPWSRWRRGMLPRGYSDGVVFRHYVARWPVERHRWDRHSSGRRHAAALWKGFGVDWLSPLVGPFRIYIREKYKTTPLFRLEIQWLSELFFSTQKKGKDWWSSGEKWREPTRPMIFLIKNFFKKTSINRFLAGVYGLLNRSSTYPIRLMRNTQSSSTYGNVVKWIESWADISMWYFRSGISMWMVYGRWFFADSTDEKASNRLPAGASGNVNVDQTLAGPYALGICEEVYLWNQSINQAFHQSINKPINQSIIRWTGQSTAFWLGHSINSPLLKRPVRLEAPKNEPW